MEKNVRNVYENKGGNGLEHQINELKSRQSDLDATLFDLMREKKLLEADVPPAKKPSAEIASHYSFIYPLVEEIYFLELKEKELKEKYQNKKLSEDARLLGQQLLAESFAKEETVLKSWHEELKEIQNSQPPLSTTSAESQDHPTVHNLVYSCHHHHHHDGYSLVEDLALTVLQQAVHARLKIQSVLPCDTIHRLSSYRTSVSVNCDIHIPGVEDAVVKSLAQNSSIQEVISVIGRYIASDMAPFVISIPIRKKGKKKKKEVVKGKEDSCIPEQHTISTPVDQ